MGAADQRVTDLLERWKASVELHARYLALDDAAYAKVQDWPRHQRPTRWVVDLARTRLLELQRMVEERNARGDVEFGDALERMAFLANLLGSEHVERFIPLAQPAPAPPVDATVEMKAPRPKAVPAATRRKAAPAPARAKTVAPATSAPSAEPATSHSPAPEGKAVAMVIADAVRFISWGREWPQLASLIARLADRPPEAEVWAILRQHRATIETRARQPRD